MKRKFADMAMVTVAALLLEGCNPMSVESTQSAEENGEWEAYLQEADTAAPNELSDHVTLTVSDTLSLDADILVSDEMETYEIPDISVTPHLFDHDTVLTELWKIFGREGEPEIEYRTTDDYLQNGEPLTAATAVTGNDDWYQVRDLYLVGMTKDGSFYENWAIYPYCELETAAGDIMALLPGDCDLDFATREEILEESVENMKRMGIEASYHTVIHTCTEERMQQIVELLEAEHILAEESEIAELEAAAGRETYFVELHEEYNGTEFVSFDVPDNINNATQFDLGTQCYFIYTEDGIQSASVQMLYDVEAEENLQTVLSLGDILRLYENRHELQVQAVEDSGDVMEEIIRIQLCYLPVYSGTGMEYKAKPVWYVLSNTGKDYSTRSVVLYDAVMGEELVW